MSWAGGVSRPHARFPPDLLAWVVQLPSKPSARFVNNGRPIDSFKLVSTTFVSFSPRVTITFSE